MSQIRRRQMFVDARLQGALLLQVALYWLYCLLSVAFVALIWIVFIKRPLSSTDLFQELWNSCGPALLGSVLLLPLVLLDCLRISNRFAGPMLRLRREMKAFGEGKVACSVLLRDGDFWWDFAEDWNRVLVRYKGLPGTAQPLNASQATQPPPPSPDAVASPVTLTNPSPADYSDSISA